jgi:predicted P-loop ATPase
VERSPYAAFCGKSFFLSLVARAYAPGCQVDTSIVLQGPEGAKKTSLCRLIGGPWYRGITLSFDSKDLFTSLKQCWLGELAELDSFARSGQARIKALLTTIEDSYRPPYGRYEIEQKRRTVFLGTTNDPCYLVDPHGARRFYPMAVKGIRVEKAAAVLPQLFAEARDRYKAGENWWEESEAVREEAQEAREQVREMDPWENLITKYAQQWPGTIHMVDIFGSLCLNVPPERQTRAMETRIGTVMHRLGYIKKRRGTGKDREYEYVTKEK